MLEMTMIIIIIMCRGEGGFRKIKLEEKKKFSPFSAYNTYVPPPNNVRAYV